MCDAYEQAQKWKQTTAERSVVKMSTKETSECAFVVHLGRCILVMMFTCLAFAYMIQNVILID